jgi:hypothetical protein
LGNYPDFAALIGRRIDACEQHRQAVEGERELIMMR